MGRNNTKSEKILDLLNQKEASLKEIKQKIGPDYQYNLNKLLIDGRIRVSGYKPTAKNFKCDQILFEIINANEKNPLNIIHLLDDLPNPESEELLFTLFKEKLEELNKKGEEDVKFLNQHLKEMSTKEMIEKINSLDNPLPWANHIAIAAEKCPNSKVWYLNVPLDELNIVYDLDTHFPFAFEKKIFYIVFGVNGIDYTGNMSKNRFINEFTPPSYYWSDLKDLKKFFYETIYYINLDQNTIKTKKMDLADNLSDYGRLKDFAEFISKLWDWKIKNHRL